MYVLCACMGGEYNFELSGELMDTFSKIAFRYISQNLDKNYKKLDILNEF